MDEQQRQARLQRRRLEQQQRNREIVADMLRHPGEGPSYWGRLAHHLVSAHNEELAAYAWDQDRQHGRGAIFLAARHLADDVLSTSWLSRAEVDALHAEGGPLSDCQPPDWQDPAKFYYAVVWLPAGMHLSGHMQTTPAAEAGRPPKRNIVACTVGAESQEHPPTLRQLGSARCVGRRVIEWSSSLGSYGMGGPGFFGMRLAATPSYSEEWLVLVLWGAAHWLILDGRWVEAHPEQYIIRRPWIGADATHGRWDELSPILLHAVIHALTITAGSSTFELEQGTERHLLQAPDNPSLLPEFAGSLLPRRWHPEEHQLDAWVVSPTSDLWC